MIQLYNTLTGKKEEFQPQNDGQVKMYVCGITPYDSCHLGHGRCYVVFDTIRRYLEYREYKVSYIQNFTDIDDKIVDRSNQAGIKIDELTEKYIAEYFQYMRKLNIKDADHYPRVTQHIPQIISDIEKIIANGYAYVSDGDVYFSVRKFEKYGQLSKRNLDDLRAGARVEPGDKKTDPLDFALWKSAKPGEPFWQSPWGNGRPGWHIECSVMSLHELQVETLDIHGGGADLIFPHHENEIAQSEAINGKPFSKYWIHNGFVTINKEKMSKSLGNFFTLQQIFEKYDPMVVRFFLLSQHYHRPLDFSDERLNQAKSSWQRIVQTKTNFDKYLTNTCHPERSEGPQNDMKNTVDSLIKEFESSMDDDFNTQEAIAAIHKIVNLIHETEQKSPAQVQQLISYPLQKMVELCGILGLTFPGKDNADEKVQELVKERELARKNKDWTKSDILRQQIKELGYIVEDTPQGSRLVKM